MSSTRIFASFALAIALASSMPRQTAANLLLRPDLPSEVRAEYGISRGNTRIGTVTETFRREADRYSITSETVAAGALGWIIRDKLTVVSQGMITSDGLRPALYTFTRERSPRKNVRATFAWTAGAAGVMTSEHDGKTARVVVEQGTLDRLSILYQWMVAPPGRERVEAWMTNGRNVTRYAYERRGSETLHTPLGTYAALHIHRKDADDGSEIDLWLAQDRHFVPLRLRLTHKDGTKDEQTLLSLSVR